MLATSSPAPARWIRRQRHASQLARTSRGATCETAKVRPAAELTGVGIRTLNVKTKTCSGTIHSVCDRHALV
jgi:hypothetical protein